MSSVAENKSYSVYFFVNEALWAVIINYINSISQGPAIGRSLVNHSSITYRTVAIKTCLPFRVTKECNMNMIILHTVGLYNLKPSNVADDFIPVTPEQVCPTT